MPATWDALLFDLDGTLIDSVPLILDSFTHAFATFGLPVPEAAQLLRGVGIPLEPHFSRYVSDPGVIERLVATYREYNLANHDARVRAFPGVREMLESVRSAGTRVGVVTSKNRTTTTRGLSIAQLSDLIEIVVPSDEVTNPKPHPEPVQRAVAQLGVRAARTVFVGDSLHDLICGRAAGVHTAAALWGPFTRVDLESAAPDYWVETPAALDQTIGVSS